MSPTVATTPCASRLRVTGKTARDEDYPFGSFLLPAHLRPHVAVFYHFARQADDIADAPDRDAATKLTLLARLDAVLDGAKDDRPEMRTAALLRQSLLATGLDASAAKDLLAAFRQDAQGWHCETWDDLLAYCRLSAAPVGRYLLALHGESPPAYGPADALCTAVQILNHLQDCGTDWASLGRNYLPQNWLRAEGADATDLAAAVCPPALRRVMDRALDGTQRLLDEAAPLPHLLRDRRLRAEAAVIQAIAQGLLRKLRAADPLHGRVAPGTVDTILAFCRGLWRAARAG